MDPESKKLLEETFELTKENNQMLNSMRRSMRMQRIVNYLYWAFIILTALGAYYFVQPYINQLMSVYSGAGDMMKNFQQFNNSN